MPVTASPSPLITHLEAIVGAGNLLTAASDLVVYECDGYTIEKNKPDVVVFPTSAEQIVAIVKTCNELNIPFIPRGAGTGLTGGIVTLHVGTVLRG